VINKNITTKSEVEENLRGRGSFVQLEYLTSLIKRELPVDVKKFVCVKLAEIYEKTNMFSDAARIYDTIAMISIKFSEKIDNYLKETQAYVKADSFERADQAMRKALGEATAVEKHRIAQEIKNFYLKLAQDYEKQLRKSHAIKIYEKLMNMPLNDIEKKQIKEKLMELYEKLGKMGDIKRLQGIK
jgi:tetratricopeptide (TPR) repeat protein